MPQLKFGGFWTPLTLRNRKNLINCTDKIANFPLGCIEYDVKKYQYIILNLFFMCVVSKLFYVYLSWIILYYSLLLLLSYSYLFIVSQVSPISRGISPG